MYADLKNKNHVLKIMHDFTNLLKEKGKDVIKL